MRSDTRPGLVCLAAVAAAHGVRGALKLRCFTEDPENVASYGPLHDEHGRELFEVKVVGAAKGGVIVQARGVEDRDAAERLRGTGLYVPRERLPETEEDEVYVEDLLGLEVFDESGAALGRVTEVHDFGAGDVIAFEDEDGTERMLPFTDQHILHTDLEAGRIVVAEIFEVGEGSGAVEGAKAG